MQFKMWFNEETKLLKKLAPVRNYNYLGKFSWWDVYSISPNGIENDYMLDNSFKLKLKSVLDNSSYKLSTLGFPRMRSTIVLTDLSKEFNSITGGGVGGYADYESHGIAISRNQINEEIIIHEHAHMFWKNIPKPNKYFFIEYFEKTIGDFAKNLPTKIKYKHFGKFKMPENLFQLGWEVFRDILQKEMNINFNRLFELKKTDDQNLFLIKSVLTPGSNNKFKLKTSIQVTRNNWGSKNLSVGDEVQVFTGHSEKGSSQKYFIEKYINHERFDFNEGKGLTFDELLNYINFDAKEIMSNDYFKKQHEKLLEIKNKSLVEILGFTKNKEFIEEAFKQVFNEIVSEINRVNRVEFNVDQFFKRYAVPSNSWISLISKRSKAGKVNNEEDIKDVYDFIVKKMFVRDLSEIEPTSFDVITKFGFSSSPTQFLQKKLQSPEGEELRSILHRSGASVNSYGASNTDELWATTVEFAALGRNVSRNLKNLVWKTLNGF